MLVLSLTSLAPPSMRQLPNGVTFRHVYADYQRFIATQGPGSPPPYTYAHFLVQLHFRCSEISKARQTAFTRCSVCSALEDLIKSTTISMQQKQMLHALLEQVRCFRFTCGHHSMPLSLICAPPFSFTPYARVGAPESHGLMVAWFTRGRVRASQRHCGVAVPNPRGRRHDALQDLRMRVRERRPA